MDPERKLFKLAIDKMTDQEFQALQSAVRQFRSRIPDEVWDEAVARPPQDRNEEIGHWLSTLLDLDDDRA